MWSLSNAFTNAFKKLDVERFSQLGCGDGICRFGPASGLAPRLGLRWRDLDFESGQRSVVQSVVHAGPEAASKRSSRSWSHWLAQPASLLRWLVDLLLPLVGARRLIQMDAREFSCKVDRDHQYSRTKRPPQPGSGEPMPVGGKDSASSCTKYVGLPTKHTGPCPQGKRRR